MWLREHEDLSIKKAYSKARKEFYRLRIREDIERQIAIEEAESVGAYFGKTNIEIGLELESQVLSSWKEQATREVTERKQRIAAASGDDETAEESVEEDASAEQKTLKP